MPGSSPPLLHTPWRDVRPTAERLTRPAGRLVRVAAGARVRNLELVGHRWSDEPEGVAANVDVRDRLLDLRHVTRYALGPRRARRVMRVRLNRGRVRSVR